MVFFANCLTLENKCANMESQPNTLGAGNIRRIDRDIDASLSVTGGCAFLFLTPERVDK